MRARTSGLIVLALLAGCAHQRVAQMESAPPPPKPRVKLAVLPVDEEQQLLGPVAKEVNKAFRDVKVAGVDDYFVSKVALEVVQLSIECVQPTSSCLVAVGKSLSANKLLLGQVTSVGKRKRDRAVRVTVTLFDVDAGEALNVVDHVYKTPELAADGAASVVAEATAEPPKRYGPEPQGGGGGGGSSAGKAVASGRKP
jgi:hypothetical protein